MKARTEVVYQTEEKFEKIVCRWESKKEARRYLTQMGLLPTGYFSDRYREKWTNTGHPQADWDADIIQGGILW